MKVLVTGAKGQLGYIAGTVMRYGYRFQVDQVDRSILANDAALDALMAGCDAVVHLAGVNRGTDDEVRNGNLAPARALAGAIARAKRAPHLVYASSIHIDRETVYGLAKAEAGRILAEACAQSGASYTEFVLPNLFGEFSRPNYNNFVGTFCHQIASGGQPTVNSDSAIELLHYADVAERIAGALLDRQIGTIRLAGTATTVGTVADRLRAYFADYSAGIFPDIGEPFARDLFNTLRSYLFPAMYPAALVRHADARGSFFECVRARDQGQTSFSTTRPGITRGDHFHFRKVERFLVLSGEAEIAIRRIGSGEVHRLRVLGDQPAFVDMPTFHTHNITNVGQGELLTLFWTNDFFDPDNTDTYAEKV